MNSKEIEEIISTMKGYFDEDFIVDFVMLSELFNETRYQILIRKAMDLESRILISGAKNNKTFYEIVKWAEEKNLAKSSTLSDRKQYLISVGLISEKPVRNGKRGRPRTLLHLTDENKKRFEEFYGKPFSSP
jgi:hypothetical protein